MLEKLKKDVCEANLLLPKHELVTFTWGNVSGIDREKGLVVIKPSGVEYDKLTKDNMVVLELLTGKVVEGEKPSSDTKTHLELYRNFLNIGGIVHTHSRWATIFAQSRKNILPFGTTHSDYFYGEVPCTRLLSKKEILGDYELETGRVILETFKNISPKEVPAVLVAGHGPFTWGITPKEAVESAVVLEEIAFMAWHNEIMSPNLEKVQQELLDKHYFRKHGKDSYYGQ